MKMLRKIADYKSLKTSQKNSMMEFLQRSDCKFALKRTHHRLFMENVPKTSCFKKNILRKKSMVD